MKGFFTIKPLNFPAVTGSIVSRIVCYWKLIKGWQTGLLLVSGLAGYLSTPGNDIVWLSLISFLGSLFLAISGSTILNMVYDTDIDSRMNRTRYRPLPSKAITSTEGWILGTLASLAGVTWSLLISIPYGLAVSAGLFFNFVIYTLWLKRRTPWSIVWGGVAGGMPVIAGRILSTGGIDLIGVLLFLAVLFWIPTHIITFSIRYRQDYLAASVPTFANLYRQKTVYLIIGLSTCLAVVAFLGAAWLIGLQTAYWYVMACLGAILITIILASSLSDSPRMNFLVFKAASVYMLIAMLLIMLGA